MDSKHRAFWLMPTLDLFARLRDGMAWAPPWLASLLIFAVAAVAAVAFHHAVVFLIRRALRRRDAFWRALLVRSRRPARMLTVLVALAAATPAAPLSSDAAGLIRHALLVAFILTMGWIAMAALDIGASLYMRRYRVDVADNLIARKHLTQVKILRRAVATLVVLVSVGLALMTIGGVRQWGVSLLAAGGAASIIVGLALQPLLANLFAGIQVAVTQPIRIDDAVLVENEFGNVEEITTTYVVIRLWDQRRMIVPLSHFLQKPFQNWTRESSNLLGTAMVHADYSVPVDEVRRKLEEIVHASPLWDKRVCVLQVTELKEQTVELRCLVSAAASGPLFDLRCEVREKLLAWLAEEHEDALPRTRQIEYRQWDGGERPTTGVGDAPARPQ
ncbi:mechanosensitive ion channel family protein [Phenylobacterium sp. J367]|uniref:mechanosensitive ion channel family protein n=1 Tax=Phenylobacterium sp. J367 TaxID=2898435 RepID=UPI002150B225|nr:mechanosensitive ion channel family protein [Phenylobacterium sp. J367]MCR5880367.1 mechanosensitive ion channel family protein [Phenylobacterium sp. J367]